MLPGYDCHKNHGQNTKLFCFVFSRPVREGYNFYCCINTTAVCGREVNRPSELCTVGDTQQQRRHVPATIGTNKLGEEKKLLGVKRLCKKNIAHNASHNGRPPRGRPRLLLLCARTEDTQRRHKFCRYRVASQKRSSSVFGTKYFDIVEKRFIIM